MTRGPVVVDYILGYGAIALMLWGGWAYLDIKREQWADSRQMSYLPSALRPVKKLYVSEQSFGPGPGGNETGIVIYRLEARLADAIAAGGVNFLQAMKPIGI